MTTSAASTPAPPSATPARSTCRPWSTTWRPRPRPRRSPSTRRSARSASRCLSDCPRFYRIGQKVELNLSSLAMTSPADAQRRAAQHQGGRETLDPTPVDNTVDATPFDESGKSAVSVSSRAGQDGQAAADVHRSHDRHDRSRCRSTCARPRASSRSAPSPGASSRARRAPASRSRPRRSASPTVTGKVKVKAGGKTYTVKLKKGKAFLRLDRFAKVGQEGHRASSTSAAARSAASSEVVTIKVRRN